MRQRGVAGENKIVMVGVLKKAANTLPIGSSVKIIYYSDITMHFNVKKHSR